MKHLETIQSKVHNSLISFERKLSFYRFKNKKIVFSNGCFDLLHYGHIEYLSKAADLGDVLIIGMNSDESVRLLKGNHRPITDFTSRSIVLASLSFVSDIIVFDEETPINLIQFIKPNVLVKGKDYEINQIAGADTVLASGGEVITIELAEGYSTSNIEKKIRKE